MAKKTKQESPLQLTVIRPCCAAIDIGSMLIVVSYSDIEGNQFVLETDAFTDDLQQVASVLSDAGVKEVAMEATGSYWMALYQILEEHGMKITVINPRHFKNVDGQKTDVKDSQWLHQLHAHGLLRGSHVAEDIYRELRTYIHERNLLQNQKSDTLNRIQRLLTEMNIKMQHLITDIEGVAAMKMLRGIAAGIDDPEKLLSLIEVSTLKARPEDLARSLRGHYRSRFIRVLQQYLVSYDFFIEQMKQYEVYIEELLKKMLPDEINDTKPVVKRKSVKARKNQYSINVKEYLKHIVGVDLTEIDGFDEINALEIVAVTGLDMSKWKTAEHFTSWLNLSPRYRKSGGKVIGHDRRVCYNKATQAFRMAAQTMWHNKGPLGLLYKRLSAKRGSGKAIKAVARKIAVIFYHMVKNKTSFDRDKLKLDTTRQQAAKIAILKKEAAKYGYVLHNIAA